MTSYPDPSSTDESVVVVAFYQVNNAKESTKFPTGEILVPLLVSDGYQRPQWRFPGGGVCDGEFPVVAAHREYTEETGLVLVPGSLSLVHTHKKPSRSKLGEEHAQHVFVGEIANLKGFLPTTKDEEETLFTALFPVEQLAHSLQTGTLLGRYPVLSWHAEFGRIALRQAMSLA